MGLKELIQRITAANTAYWDNQHPSIPDVEYDKLIEQLRILDPDNELLTYIGGHPGKHTHTKPMLSLNKAYTLAEVMFWINKVKRSPSELFVISPKYDGIAAKFEEGRLYTRGNGYIGEDITHICPIISDGYCKRYSIRSTPILGELVILDAVFKEYFSGTDPLIKRQDGLPFKNQRNAVAGLCGLKSVKGMETKVIEFYSYDNVATVTVSADEFEEQWQTNLEFISAFNTPKDGIVIKLKDEEYSESLGLTEHHPRGALAFKFTNESTTSKVLSIDWQLGMESVTPVANIEPIQLGGVTIKRVTLHNKKFVLTNDIKIGDLLTIERAGGVIPKVVGNKIQSNRKVKIPTICNYCGHELQSTEVELCCINPDCIGKCYMKLLNSCKALSLYGFGEATIKGLLNLKVNTLSGLLSIDKEKLLKVQGISELSATNLIQSIKEVKEKMTEPLLIAALCIPGIGYGLAKEIVATTSLMDLINNNFSKLLLGPIRNQWVVEYFSQETNRKEALCCFSLCIFIQPNTSAQLSICFTGKSSIPRKQLSKLALDRGYIVKDAVTSDLDLLVVSGNAQSTKLSKAQQYGIKIIPDVEFLKEE